MAVRALNIYSLPRDVYEQSTDQTVCAFRGIFGSYKAYRRGMLYMYIEQLSLFILCSPVLVVLWFAERSPLRFFSRIEHASKCLLPARIRTEAFEPAFEDEKGSFLQRRKQINSLRSLFLIFFQIRLRVVGLFLGCYWLLGKNTACAMLLRVVPNFIRKALGF